MSKEGMEEGLRAAIGGNDGLGWQLMQQSGRFFERLCIPGENTMPDDPIMQRPGLDNEAAMWAQVNSLQDQAEKGVEQKWTPCQGQLFL